jgi:DNA-binding GntR family transcriptional regulator
MATREESSPQYVVLARQLIRDIHAGVYPVGTLLPTEMALCRSTGMSRITVRAALRELEVRGLVSRRAGVGTRVETSTVANRFVHTANSVDEFLRALVKLKFRLLKQRAIAADSTLARGIGCRPGDRFQVTEALRVHVNGDAICHSVHYIPDRIAVTMPDMDGKTGSFAAAVAAAAGTEVAELRQMFDAENLGAAEARLLGAKAHDAALITTRWYYAPGNKLIMYSHSRFPKGRAIFDFRSRKEGLAPVGARAVRSRAKAKGVLSFKP